MNTIKLADGTIENAAPELVVKYHKLLTAALARGDMRAVEKIASAEDVPAVILEQLVDSVTQENVYYNVLKNQNTTDYALQAIFASSVGFPEQTAELISEHPNAEDGTLNLVLRWCEDWYDNPICNIIDHRNASVKTIVEAANIHSDFFRYAKENQPALFQFNKLITFSENRLTQRLLSTYFEAELREHAEISCGIDKTLPIQWILRGLGWAEA